MMPEPATAIATTQARRLLLTETLVAYFLRRSYVLLTVERQIFGRRNLE
jgi:uncharacterized membrane protein